MERSRLARVLFTCGNGEAGKLGLGGIFSTKLFTACHHLPDVDVHAVSCGNAHTAIVTACGTLFTCGSNQELQLGHSADVKECPVPLEVDIPEKVVSVSAGAAFTLATTEGGALYGVHARHVGTHISSSCHILLSGSRVRSVSVQVAARLPPPSPNCCDITNRAVMYIEGHTSSIFTS